MTREALTDSAGASRWWLTMGLQDYADRLARAYLWGRCTEAMALQALWDEAVRQNIAGKHGFGWEQVRDLSDSVFEQACQAIHSIHGRTFNAMAEAAHAAMRRNENAALAAAHVARSAALKPPPPYVAVAVTEAQIRQRVALARARRRS